MISHLLDINSLTEDNIKKIFITADHYKALSIKKKQPKKILENKILINLFFENSTRTKIAFTNAAINLGCNVINFDASISSLKKGESEKDTINALEHLGANFITIRHASSGIIYKFTEYIQKNIHIINSGDGCNAHPTQALLDSYTILQEKHTIKDLNILICGDILHSRVARSNIVLLEKLGANISLVSPYSLMPLCYQKNNSKCKIFYNLKEAVKNQDVIITLRLQKERMLNGLYISSPEEYSYSYGITESILQLCKKDIIILHPGPMNRNIEISNAIADNINICKANKQIENGLFIRQAILNLMNESDHKKTLFK